MSRIKKILHLKMAADYIYLAADVYGDDNLPTGNNWYVVENSDDLDFGRRNYSFNAKLYAKKHPVTGKKQYAIAFTGFNDIGDIPSVFSILANMMPPQFSDAYSFTKHAIEKHGLRARDIHFTGHSLGGFLAQAVGIAVNSQKMIVFNSPAIKEINVANIERHVRKIDKDKESKAFSTKFMKRRLIAISSSRDPIAGWGIHRGTTYQYHTDFSHHSVQKLKELIIEDSQRETTKIKMELTGEKIIGLSLSETFNMVDHERSKIQQTAIDTGVEIIGGVEKVIVGTAKGVDKVATETVKGIDKVATDTVKGVGKALTTTVKEIDKTLNDTADGIDKAFTKTFKRIKKLF